MKPEDLKQLAEYMGYEILNNSPNDWSVTKNGWSYYCKYSPLTNAEQCLELMEKFKIDILFMADKDLIKASNKNFTGEFMGHGKTINEAVAIAAIAAIKE